MSERKSGGGWYEKSAEFGEYVHPSDDTASPNKTAGRHLVGPEQDPTGALSAIMWYVYALEIERKSDDLKAEKEAFSE